MQLKLSLMQKQNEGEKSEKTAQIATTYSMMSPSGVSQRCQDSAQTAQTAWYKVKAQQM